MAKRHLKRIATPKSWPVKRKGITFVTRPHPSGHAMELHLPITVILRDLLLLAERKREVTRILEHQGVFVNGKKIVDKKAGVGFMDILSIPAAEVYGRMSVDKKGRLAIIKINEKEANTRLSQVKGKTILEKGKVQLNLLGGMSMLLPQNAYHIGDTIIFDLKEKKIKECYPLVKGNSIMLIAGKHIGEQGVIVDISGKYLIYKNNDGTAIQTLKSYAFVVGKEKAVVTIQ